MKKIKHLFNIKKDIFFKNQRYILKNIRMKTSKLEAKPSENSNKRKKKLPLQNFHQQILIKFFDIERMYTFLVLELSQ